MGSERSRRIGAVLGVAIITCTGAAWGDPSAADKETARALMEEARERRDHKDLKGALEDFQKADAVMQVPTTGFEVARAQAQLGLLVEARDTITRVLRIPVSKTEPAPFREARVNAQALDEQLANRLASMRIVVVGAADGVLPKVSVDGAEIPNAVLGVARKANPGHHVLVATTDSSEVKAEIDLREGETKDVSLTLLSTLSARPLSPPPPEPELPAPEKKAGKSRTLTYAAFGVAGVGVVVGSITGIVFLGKKSSLEKACTPDHRCPPSTYSDFDSASTMATVSTVAFIAAGVSAAVGVASLFLGNSAPPTPVKAAVSPWLGPGTAGLRGTF